MSLKLVADATYLNFPADQSVENTRCASPSTQNSSDSASWLQCKDSTFPTGSGNSRVWEIPDNVLRHWGFPGGHLEQGEDFFDCVERETLEETGLEIRATNVVGLTNDKFPELDKHYVTVFTKCERKDKQQEPQRLEPNKCDGWTWKSWQEILSMANRENGVQQLFLPVENLVRENPRLNMVISST
ncbi:putative Nudix hydrolase domain-containing protein [Seiridium unicorne]|uniref:Nudix hydrolase domain-containing protein n=1 Tax=Seiridium unicorne TaxID=138068 RepID=A0ABR2UI85_9PEZI